MQVDAQYVVSQIQDPQTNRVASSLRQYSVIITILLLEI